MNQEFTHEDICEWNTYRQLCEGNILHADYNEAEATLIEDDDDNDT